MVPYSRRHFLGTLGACSLTAGCVGSPSTRLGTDAETARSPPGGPTETASATRSPTSVEDGPTPTVRIGVGDGRPTTPTVHGNSVYVGTIDEESGAIQAADASTGERRWRTRFEFPPTASPTVVDDLLLCPIGLDRSNTGPGDGELVALRRDDGSVSWRTDIGGAGGTPVATSGRTAYVGREAVGDRHLFAIDVDDGTTRWSLDAGAHVFGGPVVAGETVYVTIRDRTLFALEAESGDRRWAADNEASPFTTGPTPDGDRLYVGCRTGVAALEAETGDVVWYYDTERQETMFQDGVFAPPDVDGDTLFAPVVHDGETSESSVIAVGASDGERAWETGIPGTFTAYTPVVTGGVVYAGLGEGTKELRALDAETGGHHWRSTDCWGRPVVEDGTLYAVGAGEIVGLSVT